MLPYVLELVLLNARISPDTGLVIDTLAEANAVSSASVMVKPPSITTAEPFSV
jgi:hypothetical protein